MSPADAGDDEHVRAAVVKLPPLTAAQVQRVAALLSTVRPRSTGATHGSARR